MQGVAYHYMQWMGIWSHHHCIITPGSTPDSRNPQQKSWVTAGLQTYHYASNEALDPPKVDHTFMADICKVFDIIHMQWMGIWSHHHCIINAGACPDLGNQQISCVTAGLQILPLHMQ